MSIWCSDCVYQNKKSNAQTIKVCHTRLLLSHLLCTTITKKVSKSKPMLKFVMASSKLWHYQNQTCRSQQHTKFHPNQMRMFWDNLHTSFHRCMRCACPLGPSDLLMQACQLVHFFGSHCAGIHCKVGLSGLHSWPWQYPPHWDPSGGDFGAYWGQGKHLWKWPCWAWFKVRCLWSSLLLVWSSASASCWCSEYLPRLWTGVPLLHCLWSTGTPSLPHLG